MSDNEFLAEVRALCAVRARKIAEMSDAELMLEAAAAIEEGVWSGLVIDELRARAEEASA